MNKAILLLIICLEVYGAFCAEESSLTEEEVNCDSECYCALKKDQYNITEFFAICTGTKGQNIFLTESLFKAEPNPDWTRKVHIKISNYTGINIDQSFLTRWILYTSCSLEILNSGQVVFPDETPPVVDTRGIVLEFAGIGIFQSSVNKLPNNLFSNKKSIKLKLGSSEMNDFNLRDVSKKALAFLLDVENSVIKVIQSNSRKSRNFKISLEKRKLNISISNSKIGFMGSNALNLDYEYEINLKGSVSIQNSTLGILESSAIKLGNGIEFRMEDCSIGYISPSAVKFNKNRSTLTSIAKNIFIVEEDYLTNSKCDSIVNINDNIVFVLNRPLNETSMDDYCKKNKIVSKSSLLKETVFLTSKFSIMSDSTSTSTSTTTLPPSTTTSPLTEQTSTPIETTDVAESILLSVSINKSLSENENNENTNIQEPAERLSETTTVIPIGLFYLVVGLSLALMVVLLLLVIYLVWNKFHKKRTNQENDRMSTIYEEPNSYFAPIPPKTLKMDSNMQFKDLMKDERYHDLEHAPVKKIKENIVFEEESS